MYVCAFAFLRYDQKFNQPIKVLFIGSQTHFEGTRDTKSHSTTHDLAEIFYFYKRNVYWVSLSMLVVFLVSPIYYAYNVLKAGLWPSEKICAIGFIESPLKIMNNAFYIILKALFFPKIFRFLSWLLDHVEKTAWLER